MTDDTKSYDGVMRMFSGGKWRDASSAISAKDGSVFISVGTKYDLVTLEMSIEMFVRAADILREHLDEDDEMDIDDVIFDRLDELSEQVGLLQAEHVTPMDLQHTRDRLIALEDRVAALEPTRPFNGRHSGGFYGTEYPVLDNLRLFTLG